MENTSNESLSFFDIFPFLYWNLLRQLWMETWLLVVNNFREIRPFFSLAGSFHLYFFFTSRERKDKKKQFLHLFGFKQVDFFWNSIYFLPVIIILCFVYKQYAIIFSREKKDEFYRLTRDFLFSECKRRAWILADKRMHFVFEGR